MIPVTRNDFIYVDFISLIANASITVTALVISKTGKIIKFERNFISDDANISRVKTIPLTSGDLISLSVRDELRTFDWGITHATIGITRIIPKPILGRQPNQLQLATGFISRTHQISYPTGSNLPPLMNQGHHAIQTIPTPSVGSDLTFITQLNELRRFYGIRFTFQTSSEVANRRVNLNIRQSSNGIYRTASDAQQTASKTIIYNFFSGINEQPLNDNIHVQSAPLIMLPEATTIETITTGLQGDDQFTEVVILFETFPTTG